MANADLQDKGLSSVGETFKYLHGYMKVHCLAAEHDREAIFMLIIIHYRQAFLFGRTLYNGDSDFKSSWSELMTD